MFIKGFIQKCIFSNMVHKKIMVSVFTVHCLQVTAVYVSLAST